MKKPDNNKQTFDQKFGKVVEVMKDYMQKTGLTMISWTDTDYWDFKLNKCSKSKIAKMKRNEKKWKGSQ